MNLHYDFSGRSVVITGGARGIGLAVARQFVDSGADVTLLDADAHAVHDAAADVGGQSTVCDVSDAAAVETAFRDVVARSGSIDVLVNNAGVLRDRVLWKLTDDDWRTVLNVHLTGTFCCTRAAVNPMREAGRGRIINVTSYTGLHGNVGQANYAAAKAGIIGLTMTAAKELARFGITVNAISPNAETRMVESIPQDKRRSLEALIPMGRFGTPDEIAHAVAFLASDEAGYVTGVVLPVDGGLAI